MLFMRPCCRGRGYGNERGMKMKLKQLLCNHRWEILYKPLGNMAIQRCVKCERVQFKKINNKKLISRNYCWCPYCGYDLVRDSYISKDKEGIVSYTCTNCNRSSKWHFTIAPIPILLKND